MSTCAAPRANPSRLYTQRPETCHAPVVPSVALPASIVGGGHDEEARTRYKVVLYPSDEGYAVGVPGLPGCWSQGTTEEEALESVTDAIQEYLAAIADFTIGADIREVDVAISCAPGDRA